MKKKVSGIDFLIFFEKLLKRIWRYQKLEVRERERERERCCEQKKRFEFLALERRKKLNLLILLKNCSISKINLSFALSCVGLSKSASAAQK